MANVKCPKGETLWVCYSNKDNCVKFIITTKGMDRSAFFLYEVSQDNTYKKLGKSKSPIDLERKFKVLEALSE